MLNTAFAYFKKHPVYNALVHLSGGVSIGILITYPVVGVHPLRWGLVLLMVFVLGYLPPLTGSK